MPLVTSKRILLDAKKYGYAIAAFNVENMEMIQAVVEAANELCAPVIMQTTPSTLKYATPQLFYSNVACVANMSSIPIVMHLDHGNSYDLALKCLGAKYSSIMIDGSTLSYSDNINLTNYVVKKCHNKGIPVEAELGKVGGKEDELENNANNLYTDPDQAKIFCEKTQCDSLAVGIGTAHGIYKGIPNIRIDILKSINASVDCPLVMHGTSGVDDDIVINAINNGICKVNYATDLRIVYTKAVREVLSTDKNIYDPKSYGFLAKKYVKDYVKSKIILCSNKGI